MSSLTNVMYKISSSLQPFHMMAQHASFIVLVAALLITTLSFCSAENVYCVTPTATSCSSCPHNSTHCATLSEYAQEAEMYFTSNTTMVFLPGDHTLDTNITVANVSRLTMCGDFSSGNIATVVRNGSVGFSFTNMVDFNIDFLAFTSYTGSWSYGSLLASNSTLFFLQSTQYAKLVNCSFHDNFGTALTVHNTSITLTGNNEFVHNQCGCESFSYNCKLGCGITALNSNLTCTGNTTFHENNASYYGSAGAIWASASSLDFDGTNNFINNSAEWYGGAIHVERYSSLRFLGTSTFGNNTALYGGVINPYDNAVLIFNGTNNFINNLAKEYGSGGAINAGAYSSIHFLGTSTFSNNTAHYGGVINALYEVVFTFNGTNNFINNSAKEYGGAISAYEGVFTFTGFSSFSSNSAKQGGATSAYYNSKLTFYGNISFTNNTANSHGGALYLYISSTFSILPHTTVCWENNHANLGGAIFVRLSYTVDPTNN